MTVYFAKRELCLKINLTYGTLSQALITRIHRIVTQNASRNRSWNMGTTSQHADVRSEVQLPPAVPLFMRPCSRYPASRQQPRWDGTPAPIPAPQDVRRGINSLLVPDPDERLRDKLIKTRKAAAGLPLSISTIRDEVTHPSPKCLQRIVDRFMGENAG